MPNNYPQVATRRQLRAFIQPGGPNISNRLILAGVNGGPVEITGTTRPSIGGIDPINMFDPVNTQAYQTVGDTISEPKFPEATLMIHELKQGIPLADILGGCPINLYEVKGECADVSDFLKGWKGGNVRIYSLATVIDANPGDRTGMNKDDGLMHELKLSLRDNYVIGSMGFGEQSFASALTNQIATAVTYGNALICGNCGTPNDGTQFAYVAFQASTTSPGAKPQVGYTINGGSSWVLASVTSAAVAENLVDIKTIGDKLVVLSKTGGGSSTSAIHYATVGATGAPGAWTKVTTGFVGGKPANEIFILSNNEIFFVADGAYIYKSTDITAGVSVAATGIGSGNITRIAGNNQVMVVADDNNGIYYSINRGRTWSASATTPGAGGNFTALEVIDSQKWWIYDTANGVFSGTINGGASWVISNPAAPTITDIMFVTAEVGFYTANLGGAGLIYGTFNGGVSWTNVTPRIDGLGTVASFNRIAAPQVGNTSLRANNALAVGAKTASTLGVVVQGSAAVL